jgi:hypothetical protein
MFYIKLKKGVVFLKDGKIRIKTLVKFLSLVNLTRDRNRLLTVEEIVEEIHCCKGHAYNYRRALEIVFPPRYFDPNRRSLTQQCLTT